MRNLLIGLRSPRAFALVATLLVGFQVDAAPLIGPPVNQASFLPPGIPQYGIARGSMFAVFGQEMGPSELIVVSEFPVPAELAGTSVQVAVGGRTFDCPVVFTSASQLAAILPSDALLGEGALTVTYEGETSPPAPILVVRSTVGIFTLRQDGRGPGVFTDPSFAVNTVVNAFAPNNVAIAWVTGLGPRGADDRAVPEDLKDELDLEVLVGETPANVLYAGPSGCCAGVDQISFEIPEGQEGCFVPVIVRVGETFSNFASMAISSAGATCSDPHGFSAEQIEQMQEDGELTVGFLTLSQTFSSSVLFNPPEQAASANPAQTIDVGTPGFSASLATGRYLFNRWQVSNQPLGLQSSLFELDRNGNRDDPFGPDLLPQTGEIAILFPDSEIPTVVLSEENDFSANFDAGDGQAIPDFAVQVEAFGLGGADSSVVSDEFPSPLNDLPNNRFRDYFSINLAVRLAQQQDEKWVNPAPGDEYQLEFDGEAPPAGRPLFVLTEANFRDQVSPEVGFTYNVSRSVRPNQMGRFELARTATAHMPSPTAFGPGFWRIRVADLKAPKIQIGGPDSPLDFLVVTENMVVRRDYLWLEPLALTADFLNADNPFAANCNSFVGFDGIRYQCAANGPVVAFTINVGAPGTKQLAEILRVPLDGAARFDVSVSGQTFAEMLGENVCEIFVAVEAQDNNWSAGTPAPPIRDADAFATCP